MVAAFAMLRPGGWMSYLLFWVWMMAVVAGAQDLVQSQPSAEAILLGQEVRWQVQVSGAAGRPQLAALPSCAPHNLRIVEEEVSQNPEGLWDGRWTAVFRPATAGTLTVPGLSVLLGKKDLVGRAFALDVRRDDLGGQVAFLTWQVERRRLWLGETVDIVLSLGVESTFLEEKLVQPFRRPLDIPVQIESLQPLLGLTLKSQEQPKDEGARSLVYGGLRELWHSVPDLVKDGRTYKVVQKRFSLTCDQEGELRLAGFLGRLRFATAWKEDFFEGRVPREIEEAFVYGGDVLLTVKPLPLAGRPPSWQGAMGEWRLGVEVRGTPCNVGDTFQLIVDVQGKGQDVPAPWLDSAPGLRVVGAARLFDEKPGRFRFDLLALSAGVLDLPSVTVASFLPRSGTYRRFAASPLKVKVSGVPESVSPGEGSRAAAWDAPWQEAVESFLLPGDVPGVAGGRLEQRGAAWIVTLLPWLGALIWGWWLRQKAWRRDHPELWRAQRAFKEYGRVRRRGARGCGDALLAYVAAHLHCREAALYRPDWQQLLGLLELDADLEGELQEMLIHLIHARYRGRPDGLDGHAVDKLVARIETSRRRKKA